MFSDNGSAKTVMAKTVNNVLTVLSVLLKKAVEWEVIDTMPCTIRVLPVVRREASFHDFDAYARLVEAARIKGWRTHLIVLLGDAGLRAGEMVALHWADVDFSRRRLAIRHSDWRGKLTTPKNGRVRYVPLTERLCEALREYRHLRGPRVLCKDDGRPISRQSAWTRVWRAVRVAGVPTGVHILRHTFCSHLAMQGAPSIAIQGLAGHQEMSVTQRYMHRSPDVLGSSIQLLESRPRRGERGDISNDAGEVKTHVLRSGRRSRLSTAKESAEAAVAQAVRVGDVHPFTLALFTVFPVVPTKHLFGHNGP